MKKLLRSLYSRKRNTVTFGVQNGGKNTKENGPNWNINSKLNNTRVEIII